jgi:hypothetical protein
MFMFNIYIVFNVQSDYKIILVLQRQKAFKNNLSWSNAMSCHTRILDTLSIEFLLNGGGNNRRGRSKDSVFSIQIFWIYRLFVHKICCIGDSIFVSFKINKKTVIVTVLQCILLFNNFYNSIITKSIHILNK